MPPLFVTSCLQTWAARATLRLRDMFIYLCGAFKKQHSSLCVWGGLVCIAVVDLSLCPYSPLTCLSDLITGRLFNLVNWLLRLSPPQCVCLCPCMRWQVRVSSVQPWFASYMCVFVISGCNGSTHTHTQGETFGCTRKVNTEVTHDANECCA